jgi:hypothetical protein
MTDRLDIQPTAVVFADGREPTTNERHLLNLLSWREREAIENKVEIDRLRGIIDSLAARCQQQSELLRLLKDGDEWIHVCPDCAR